MENSIQSTKKFLLLLIFLVVFTWALSGVIIFYATSSWADRGTIGDMFGAVNALFSGLAFVGLIYTIIMQRQEIKMNRQEIEMNRKELKKSASAQIKSQVALKEQVRQTHLTAKINAISTVINYYNIQIANQNNSPELIEKSRLKRKSLIQQLDELIDGLDDSNVD